MNNKDFFFSLSIVGFARFFHSFLQIAKRQTIKIVIEMFPSESSNFNELATFWVAFELHKNLGKLQFES